MDGKFLSTYNEVILDNFTAVLKQNFMFQTQLKFTEEVAKEKANLEKKLASLSTEQTDISKLHDEISNLNSIITGKDAIIQSSVNSDIDKHRLQTAVNGQMKEIESFKNKIIELQQQQEEQKSYIAQLEEMLPNTKKKKLGIIIPELEETQSTGEPTTPDKEEANVLKFTSSGGSF